jgi:hypothetical protein
VEWAAYVELDILFYAALSVTVNARTTFAQQKGSPPPSDTIIMTVQLQPHENEFLAKDSYFPSKYIRCEC